MALPLAVAAFALQAATVQPAQASEADREPGVYQEGDVVVLRFGFPVRPLPFRLSITADHRPRSLEELVDIIYAGLPTEQRRKIGNFYGASGFEADRAQYPAITDQYRSLYLIEILHEADRIWGYDDSTHPLLTRFHCVSLRLVEQLGLQIGARYIREEHASGQPISDRASSTLQTDTVSQRLFQVCDSEPLARRASRVQGARSERVIR